MGLVVSAWLAVAQIESGETTSGEANPQAIADSVDRIPGSDSGRTKQSLDDAIDFARAHRQSLQHVSDYTAIFSMAEVVDGRVISHTMDLKFRRQPFSVYARCHAKRQPAREVIYVAGKNDDKLLIHEGGLKALVTMRLKPDDPRVMAENRYPITEIGMAKMLDTVLAIWERERNIDRENAEVTFSSSARLAGTPCEEIQITRRQRHPGLKFHATRLLFDKKTGFPVEVEQYDWPEQAGEQAPLVEHYTYTEIKTNAGLTDADFDPGNPGYRFGSATLP
jgi:hypothetical protein